MSGWDDTVEWSNISNAITYHDKLIDVTLDNWGKKYNHKSYYMKPLEHTISAQIAIYPKLVIWGYIRQLKIPR